MLNIIRNLVKSIAGKILLLVMVASFAVWGMGDLLRSGDSGLVAVIGNQKITINEFYYQFQKKLNEFNQSLDIKLTEEEAHNQKITYLVLNEMVYGKIIQEYAEKNSIYLSDNVLKKAIVSIPQFQDSDGNFNKILFDNSLLGNFNSEVEFTDEISKVLLNNLLFENFTIPTPLNEKILNIFYNYESETRNILYFNINDTLIKKTINTDKSYIDFYNKNENDYLINKKIIIRYLKANPDKFASLVDITNEEIEIYYNENIDLYKEDETREIEIISTNTIEQANIIIEIINDDIKLTQYLNQESLSISKLNNVKIDDFDEEISNNIFNNSVGVIPNPIKLDEIGYFVININEIYPSKITTIDESRNEIIKILKNEKSYSLFLEKIDFIEELYLTGSTLDEISDDFNLKINNADLEELSLIINTEDYDKILNSNTGYQSDLIINDDDIYIVETLDVIESSIPTYQEIKTKVENDYNNFQTDE